eukprot:TRINITY_DN6943_c0_g1_i6.p7 TRINITY_DN6943_c0_g1~~TRINITY_DN6943_c0_g1_i6.p7  ORF type:complete len:113 (-),score=0.66 TRINITY_DN6943_c0_g1_i6:1177-1515(-)
MHLHIVRITSKKLLTGTLALTKKRYTYSIYISHTNNIPHKYKQKKSTKRAPAKQFTKLFRLKVHKYQQSLSLPFPPQQAPLPLVSKIANAWMKCVQTFIEPHFIFYQYENKR